MSLKEIEVTLRLTKDTDTGDTLATVSYREGFSLPPSEPRCQIHGRDFWNDAADLCVCCTLSPPSGTGQIYQGGSFETARQVLISQMHRATKRIFMKWLKEA